MWWKPSAAWSEFSRAPMNVVTPCWYHRVLLVWVQTWPSSQLICVVTLCSESTPQLWRPLKDTHWTVSREIWCRPTQGQVSRWSPATSSIQYQHWNRYAKSSEFLTKITLLMPFVGWTFNAVVTGVRFDWRRLPCSCKRVPSVLLNIASLYRGRTDVSYQRCQNWSHAGRSGVHTRCRLGFLPQVSSTLLFLCLETCFGKCISLRSQCYWLWTDV